MNWIRTIWYHGTPYISEAGAKRLPYYKYTINDDSLFYRYFWSPLADYVTEYTPKWMAYRVLLANL